MNTQTYTYEIKNQLVIDNFLSLKPRLIKKQLNLDEVQYLSVKKYFKKIQKNKYKFTDEYEISDCGRMYGKNKTIQSINSSLRSALFINDAVDIDMVNCAFNIIKYIIRTYFKEHENDYNTLIDYTNNRNNYCNDQFDKAKWKEIFLHPNPKNFINKDKYENKINRLILEISMFQELTVKNKDMFNINYKPNSHNGSIVSYVIFNIENEILQQVIKKYQKVIIAPVFDGLIVDKTYGDNVLDYANEIGKKYDIKFINKPFKQLSFNLQSPPDYKTAINSKYEEMKTEFEKDHFMVENPLLFVKEYESYGETNFIYYNKNDFVNVVAPYQLEDLEGKEIPFFYEWIKDDNRRSYKTNNFIPSLKEEDNPIDNYNSFKGVKAKIVEMPKDKNEQIKLETDVYDGNAVLRYITHLRHLVNNETGGFHYLMGYIADLFQNPCNLPKVAILFKSKEGSGKDLMTDILGDIIGNNLLHKEPKMENVTGTFNTSIRNKLMVQLNEVCGKDGSFNRELLKDLITCDKLNIREMRKDVQKTINCLRLFLATNNRTPINIPQDDRRYVVFKCSDPKTTEYYNELGKIRTNQKSLNSIYTYFMNYDISKFNIRDRYISQEYLNLQQQTTNPFHEFLHEFCLDHSEYIIRNNNDFNYVSKNEIYEGYVRYLKDEKLSDSIQTNKRDMKSLIVDCGVVEEKVRINKKPTHTFKFKFDLLQKHLEKHYIKDSNDMVEFNDEDVEFINDD